MKHGDNWTFDAAVTNASDRTVIWSIQEGSRGGAVSDIGVYTAPAANGIYHVIATSKADPTKSATTTVNVGETGFTLTGSSTYARSGHTATLLPNGQVYIAGGVRDDSGLRFRNHRSSRAVQSGYGYISARRKDQREDIIPRLFFRMVTSYLPGASMAKHTHKGALIPAATAELLKAGSGSVQPTGSMGVGRYSHTATILRDGRVLITGGTAGPNANSRRKRLNSTIRPRAHSRQWAT